MIKSYSCWSGVFLWDSSCMHGSFSQNNFFCSWKVTLRPIVFIKHLWLKRSCFIINRLICIGIHLYSLEEYTWSNLSFIYTLKLGLGWIFRHVGMCVCICVCECVWVRKTFKVRGISATVYWNSDEKTTTLWCLQ